MFKRKASDLGDGNASSHKRVADFKTNHSLDSDEEEVEDVTNVLNEEEIEGEEDGPTKNFDGQYMTAFNMKEEMEEGHFDRDGHFIWKNEKEIRDNWLDNIDWQKVASVNNYKLVDDSKGIADESSDDDNEDDEKFNELESYEALLKYVQKGETVDAALKRLGANTKKLSSLERLKMKKAGTLPTSNDVMELTEIANRILSKTGNMDIYQQTFANIIQKIEKFKSKGKQKMCIDSSLDMYADDFDDKEKQNLNKNVTDSSVTNEIEENNEVMWEVKRNESSENTEGPFSSEQMLKWVKEEHFETGSLVRKCGQNSTFCSLSRIDFELYF